MSEEVQTAEAAKKKATEVETVSMDDGRLVDFAGKRKLLKEAFVKDGKVSVRLDFRNGETRTFTIPDTLLAKFAAHGAEQKLGDEIAGLDDIADCVEAVDQLMERLAKGEWTVKREGGQSLAGFSVLAQALAKARNLPMETVRAFLKDKTHEQKLALRNSPSIKPIIQEIEAEKAAKKKPKENSVDTEALLAQLG